MQFAADYFDGISPRAKRVLVSIDGDYFRFATHEAEPTQDKQFAFLISDCHVQAKLGSGKRLIDLPDDSRLETDFQALEQHLPHTQRSTFWRAVHFAENHRFIILVALLGIAALSVFLLRYGVPAAAKYTAMLTPPAIEKDLGKQTLNTLDSETLGYFAASELPASKQKEIETALNNLCQKTRNCPAYQLMFRKSPVIGANAFALPGGYVVMTDELVDLAKNNDEIIAVLAHELGHVKNRHALRQALQGSISGLILIAITGDASSIAAGLPTAILTMSYSRELETDADNYARTAMQTACIPTKYFASLLLRLESAHGGSGTVPEVVASHPDTQQRIKPFMTNHPACNK